MEESLISILEGLPTIVLFIIIILSLNSLGKGADMLVDEAVKLSVRWGISKMVIGATIVSLGTTIPEMTVSVAGSLAGNPGLALGNGVGSIITNTTLIIGVASLFGNLKVERQIIDRQGRIQLISAIVLVLISLPFINSSIINKTMGYFFILLLIGYMVLTVYWSKKNEAEYDDSYVEDDEPISKQLVLLILGIILVIISSKILIPTVEIAAVRIGIPQAVVAATLVAFGTSVPELMTSITAVKKGYGELAIGNVVGANILNVLFVVGISASVSQTGLLVPDIFYRLQYPTMLISLVSLHIFARSKEKEITKRNGLFLVLIYFIYLILNYIML